MAAPKAVKKLGGANPSASDTVAAQYDPPSAPLDQGSLWQAILQLQNSLNELIKHYNAHTHGGVTVGAGSTGVASELQTGAGATAQNLFTTS